ncbi:hypothetical protein K440DRAFT_679894 [Wilcoxina mikolae CBS 423.85]|nr:hypothetical protein K440DRAFT_679894 [Wilcoxina mikolae CBS 423.85]
MTPHFGMGGTVSRGGSFSTTHLKQHQPPFFTGDLKLETVNLFLRNVEHQIRQGGVAIGTTESDKRIDLAWQFMNPETYNWFIRWIGQQGVMLLIESTVCHRFVPEVTITAVRNEICMLCYSRGVGEVRYFNKRFSKLINMLQKETNITCEDPLYDEYCFKFPAGITDRIIASAHMQKKLKPDISFMLAYTMEMVSKLSERMTLHLAVMAMHECGYAFRARSGRNCSRWDGGLDRNDTHHGGPGTYTRSAATSIHNFHAAAVDDPSMNDNGENSAVEQQIMEEEDDQGNGNCE